MESLTFVGYFQPSKTDIICSFAFKLLNLDNITKNKVQSVKKDFCEKYKCGHFWSTIILYFLSLFPYGSLTISFRKCNFANS